MSDVSNTETRAIRYAEDTLGVHDAFDAGKQALLDLKGAQAAMVEWAGRKRELVETMNERTALLASDERAKYHDLSATAFEQHMKGASQTDPDLKRLRAEYMEAQRHHDSAEADVKEAEFRCRMYGARMEELGGLLSFYAAVKQGRAAST